MHIPTVNRFTANYTPQRREYRNIFLHATRGPGNRTLEAEYHATIAYFLRAETAASAHYVVGPTEVTRMVQDGDTAWHARENNPTSLSIELAQPSVQPPFTDFQYYATASICRTWCANYGIPVLRVFSQEQRGIIGHEDSEQGKKDGKSDPGPQWEWDRLFHYIAADTGQDWQTVIDVTRGWGRELAAMPAQLPVAAMLERMQAGASELTDVAAMLERLRPS